MAQTNVTGKRRWVIVSPSGVLHAPRRSFDGEYVRRYDWYLTACGQIADYGWSQRRLYGYVECRQCIAWLERHEG
jgi:hypothetical protein